MTTDIDALVERLALHSSWRDSHGELNDAPINAAQALTRLSEENARLREALEGYRAAVQWVAADSWDGCSDCIEILKMAANRDVDFGFTPDEHAHALKRLRDRAALQGDA